jgi:hypothetical protein
MGFILIEERADAVNPYKYYTYPVFAGPFATREEAEAEKALRKPENGGVIRVVPEPLPQGKKLKKGATRDTSRRGGGTRTGGRR